MTERVYIRVIETLCIAGLILMVGMTFISTAMRVLPGAGGLYWAEEITRYTSIWVVFLASGLTIRYGVHFRVDLLVRTVPMPLQVVTALFACFVMLCFEVVLIWFGTIVAISNMDQQSTSLEFPMGFAYAAIPVGGLLMLYETLRAVKRAFVNPEHALGPESSVAPLAD
jgi:TRAP-type C4-dicarboxylate transport system permease small subunit